MIYSYYDPRYSTNERERPLTSVKPSFALQYGNLFNDEYIGYKNYNPSYPIPSNEMDELMRKIQEYTNASQELKLFLDVNPNREDYYNLFIEYNRKVNELVREYESKYYPIFAGNSYFINGYFTWITSPSVFNKGVK